jgi:hypothetical protein
VMESIANELTKLLMGSFYGHRAEQSIIAIYKGYEKAQELTDSNFMEAEAHDLRPHIRRGCIEQGWKTQMKALPGVVATSEKVAGGGNSFAKVTFDDRLTVTISASDAAWSLPRYAEYRKGYAKLQLNLFPTGDIEVIESSRYAIITHGPSPARRTGTLPLAFCQIGFPDNSYTYFVHRVNLFKCYASLFRKLLANEPIVIGEATAELLESIAREQKAS